MEVKLPPPVKPENKVNVFMIGPEACGKTTAANYMAQEH
jgi:ATP-dependent protease Clp ATPase subunit